MNTHPGARALLLIAALLLSPAALAHGMSVAEKQAIVSGGLGTYFQLGALHMLTGYDHLLFVFGVVLLLTRFLDVVKYITGFTLGHTLTLILATWSGLAINYFLIDAFVALSICYIAFVNLGGFQRHFDRQPPGMLAMVVSIGLVHGLGLSTRLQELPLASDGLLGQILAFNLGVEAGQLTALVLMLGGLWLLRRGPLPAFHKPANLAIGAIGGLLFLSQLHGYSHQLAPDEFGFSADLHQHAHQAMQAQALRERALEELVLEELPEPTATGAVQ